MARPPRPNEIERASADRLLHLYRAACDKLAAHGWHGARLASVWASDLWLELDSRGLEDRAREIEKSADPRAVNAADSCSKSVSQSGSADNGARGADPGSQSRSEPLTEQDAANLATVDLLSVYRRLADHLATLGDWRRDPAASESLGVASCELRNRDGGFERAVAIDRSVTR